ncbi:glutamyl-tRNA reductase [Uliginosibacterium sp. H1]|uniref:glutamyl-tRNA reductase n=1 Tax=Uliginosibacterium sp. H1 TaxID=3114757 RepID=UPI002E1884CE|nr:glutamyl-tRNA reductase [Uliginosibacterium sp. H1]
MPLFALGLNHQTAPVAIRERVAIQPERLRAALADLSGGGAVMEAAIVSTCNRTELVCATDAPEHAAAWLARYHGLSLAEIAPYLYTYPDREAVRHIFRVASGLDSMVLGEPQILGQMKEAARHAESAGTLGSLLHKLFQNSFAVAKEVRSTTAIGANIVSMAAAAVHLSERIFERVDDCSVLFIGAGEMIDLCAAHFAGANPRRMTIANRTVARAEALALRVRADVLPLEAVAERLSHYDVVVSCTASPLPIIGRGMAERAIKARRRRPMVMVDLAVPRDIEPEAAQISDVFLYTVDDLAQIVSAGVESRHAAVQEAEAIIDTGVSGFLQWVANRDAVPTIRALREQAESLRQTEMERALRALSRGDDPQAVLEALSQGLTNKLLHGPTQFLRSAEGVQAVDTVQRLFQLDQLDGRADDASRDAHNDDPA